MWNDEIVLGICCPLLMCGGCVIYLCDMIFNKRYINCLYERVKFDRWTVPVIARIVMAVVVFAMASSAAIIMSCRL